MPIEPDVGYAVYNEEGQLRIYCKSIGLYLHMYMRKKCKVNAINLNADKNIKPQE